MRVGDAVREAEGLGDGVRVIVGVAVRVAEGTPLGVRLGVLVIVELALGVAVAVGGVPVTVAVGSVQSGVGSLRQPYAGLQESPVQARPSSQSSIWQ